VPRKRDESKGTSKKEAMILGATEGTGLSRTVVGWRDLSSRGLSAVGRKAERK